MAGEKWHIKKTIKVRAQCHVCKQVTSSYSDTEEGARYLAAQAGWYNHVEAGPDSAEMFFCSPMCQLAWEEEQEIAGGLDG